MPMRKKQRKKGASRASAGPEQAPPPPSDFYSPAPTERPLYEDRKRRDPRDTRPTARHKKKAGKRKEHTIDMRDKAALVAILRSIVVILLLIIALFVLWKGTALYEESRVAADMEKGAPSREMTPVVQAVELVQDFDISSQEDRMKFAERIQEWQDADRMVGTADALLLRNLYDQAIAQCMDALKRDPSHLGALERLGGLYYDKGDYTNAVNAYIRLMSVNPSDKKIQKRLIQALDAFGDDRAVIYMANWYFDQNLYDPDVQRYLANAFFRQEEFEKAEEAFDRVLGDNPNDTDSMEKQAVACMQLGHYDKAVDLLEILRKRNYQNPEYYKQIAICNAQMKRGEATVDTLGQAAQLFGQQMVLGILQNPKLDPVREDPAFQAFADRVGGEEFRLWLEKMAKDIKVGQQELPEAKPLQLNVPSIKKEQDAELLKLKK